MKNKRVKILGVALCLSVSDINASEDESGYLSIGLGYFQQESPLQNDVKEFQFYVNGRYQKYGMFVELGTGPNHGETLPAIGYNFYSTDHWNLDLIGAIPDGDIHLKIKSDVDGAPEEIFRDRTVGAGFRAIGTWGNSSLQLTTLPYYNEEFDSENLIDYASLWLSHRWQIQNWSLTGTLGAKYRSSGLTNYMYGIDENEANELLPYYNADSSMEYTAQLSLSRPITKNVLFQTYIRQTEFSDSILDSPIVTAVRNYDSRAPSETGFGFIFSYVF